MIKRRLRWVFLGVLGSVLSGCDLPPEGATLLVRAQEEAKSSWGVLTGQPSAQPSSTSPSGVKTQAPSAGETLGEGEFASAAARNAKANSELFHEMFLVVFMREPKDRSEFGNWVDTLNQGASFEGVHNGLVKSSEYRKLETAGTAASVEALRVFSEELAVLELELPTPTEFDYFSGAPTPPPGAPVPLPSPTRDTLDAPVPGPSVDPAIKANELTQKYMKQFVGAPIFLLKRTLADEALRVISSKTTFKEKIAVWYSKWVVHMAERKVSFGVALRNKADADFHYKWAIEASPDRLAWEVLNRLHRVLNEANREKQ